MSASAKKFKRVILHVGPDKTGSTAIQNILAHNKELLMSYGVKYSCGHYKNDNLLRVHFLSEQNLSSRLNASNIAPPDNLKEKSNRYIKQLKKEIADTDAKELILSHEGFVELNKAELSDLRDFLFEYTNKVEIVFYIRDPIAYAKSAMSQRVKTGRRAWGMSVPFHNFQLYLGNLIAIFGKEQVKPRLYARQLFPGGDVVRDFISLLPHSEQIQLKLTESRGGEENSSLSKKAILIGDQVVALLGRDVPFAREFRAKFVPELMFFDEQNTKKSTILKKHQIKEIVELTRDQLKYLNKTFGIYLDMSHIHDESQKSLEISETEAKKLAQELVQKVIPELRVKNDYISSLIPDKWKSFLRLKANKIKHKAKFF